MTESNDQLLKTIDQWMKDNDKDHNHQLEVT
jgi:hypothetical protein